MRFGILRTKTVLGANVAGFILGTALFSMFLMLTLYMQQVLGYSAMKTGVAYLAVAGTAIVWSAVAAQLVTRIGVKPVLTAGMTFLTAGLVLFTQVPVDGSYAAATVGAWRASIPLNTIAPPGTTMRASSAASDTNGPARMFATTTSTRCFGNESGALIAMRASQPFKRALSRVAISACSSLSIAHARLAPSASAAIASTPEPQP